MAGRGPWHLLCTSFLNNYERDDVSSSVVAGRPGGLVVTRRAIVTGTGIP